MFTPAPEYSGKFITSSLTSNGVLLVELCRAPVNAFHQPMWEELHAIFEKIDLNGDIRAVILASSLKLFSAGLDITAQNLFVAPDPSRRALHLRNHILQFQAAISSIERCRQPVIGAVHGIAYGLSIDILAACDIRFAASSTSFAIKEVDVGLAADIGTLARLPKATGNSSLARELAMTARTFGPDEALRLGFISQVVQGGREEVLAKAVATADLIASKSPIAVVGTKHIMLHSRDHSVQENLDYTATWNQVMLQSTDLRDAFQAFLAKKPVRFGGLGKL